MYSAIVSIGLMITSSTQATNIASGDPISIPDGAVGVSEEAFTELKNAHCYFEETKDAIEISTGVYCDSLLAILHNKIIFRGHHLGEMYWLNTADGLSTGPHRYLPDGMYTSNNNYFIVSQGIKKRIRKDSAYDSIVAFAQGAKAGNSLSTPINETNWNAFVKTCDEIETELSDQKDNLPYSVLFGQCERGEIEGIWQSDSYLGQLILRVEDNGSLYYVRPNNYWATVHVIPTNNAGVIDLAQTVSSTMSSKVMKKLVPFAPLYN